MPTAWEKISTYRTILAKQLANRLFIYLFISSPPPLFFLIVHRRWHRFLHASWNVERAKVEARRRAFFHYRRSGNNGTGDLALRAKIKARWRRMGGEEEASSRKESFLFLISCFSSRIYIYTSPLNGEAAFDFPRGRSTGLLNIQSANFVGPLPSFISLFLPSLQRERERERGGVPIPVEQNESFDSFLYLPELCSLAFPSTIKLRI